MHRSLTLAFSVSALALVAALDTAQAGFGHQMRRAAAAPACPCVIMEGGAGARGVTGGYTIAPMKSCAVPVGRHRYVRVCKLPGYTVATPWSIYCCGGYGCASCGCGDCGQACGAGCGGSGCVGACSNCGGAGCSDAATVEGESYDSEANEQIIHDGPAPDPAPESTNEAALGRGFQYRLVSDSRGDGWAAFAKGLNAFRARSLTTALQDFETAAQAEPGNAMYHYMRALTLYDLHGAEAGAEALQQAVEAERQEPIANWGKRMERVQGRGRVWIEKARRDAGLVR